MAKETKEDVEDVEAIKASQRRAAEVKGQAALDPNTVVEVAFTGGVNGKAKHREYVGKGENRVHKLLDRNAPMAERTVRMKRSRFAKLSDRFELIA